MFTNFTSKAIALVLLFSTAITCAIAQNAVTSYAQVYSANIKGGTTVLGNTSMNIVSTRSGNVSTTKMNEISDPANGQGGVGYTQYGNDNENMQFADIDAVASTLNSTSANIMLPAGVNTIKFARLYWGGRILNSAIASVADTLRKVKIRKNAGGYSNVLAPSTSVDQFAIAGTSETVYQSYSDVTAYLQGAVNGDVITVADIPATEGSTDNGGRFAGWSIVIAYENTAALLNSVRIYHGYYQVFTNTSGPASISVTLNDLNVPNNSLSASDATMSVMGWEGDGNLGATSSNPEGDFVKVNNVVVANAANAGTNFWNGSISNNGAYVTTKSPNYSNQMGIDIDQVNVGTGYGILPNATSVTLTFGTETDQYFPSYFAFTLRSKDPLVTVKKTVVDANNNGQVESNEVLTYTLTGTNVGPGQANNVYVVDSLPLNVSYVPGSMMVVAATGANLGVQTDAIDNTDKSYKAVVGGREYVKFFLGNGATNSSGGTMSVGDAYTVKFQVKSQVIPGSINNTATSYAYSAVGDLFTDASTAVIGPLGAPLAVKLTLFTATLKNKDALLNWVTESELNNDHFEVQRSEDGVNFTTIAIVQGNGTSGNVHSYSYTDNLTAATAAIVYYRLKDVDNNNKFGYSQIVLVRLNGAFSVSDISVYPNPFASDVKIFIKSAKQVPAIFKIIAANGTEVIVKKVTVSAGNNVVVLNDMARLPKGNYIIEVLTDTDKFTKSIMKN